MAGEARFTPEAADFAAVARGSFRRSLSRRRFRIRLAIILLLGAFGGIAVSGGPGSEGWWQVAIIGTAAAAAWLGLILLGTWALIPRRTGRLFRQQRSLHGIHVFAWSDSGAIFTSEAGQSDFGWDRYHHWFESPDVFAFGLNEQLFHWVPKRAMTRDAADDLRRTVDATGLLRA